MTTKIEWVRSPGGALGETWNAVTGCSKISPGCANCYAERQALGRLKGSAGYPGLPWTQGNTATNVVLHPERVFAPLRKRKPTTYFVNSMSDLFHEKIPNEFIAAMFGVMAATPRHTFQILTKRPAAMVRWFEWVKRQDEPATSSGTSSKDGTPGRLESCWRALDHEREYHPKGDSGPLHMKQSADPVGPWPLPNVWIGVSVEDQKRADERITLLLDTPAAVRFLSVEPMLGPIGFDRGARGAHLYTTDAAIDWIIVGGESGPGARPMHPDWPRSIRDQCAAAGVPFFFKQWGEWGFGDRGDYVIVWPNGDSSIRTESPRQFDRFGAAVPPVARLLDGEWEAFTLRRVGKKAAGAELDGRTWREMPKGFADGR